MIYKANDYKIEIWLHVFDKIDALRIMVLELCDLRNTIMIATT